MGNRTSYLVDVAMRLNDQASSGLDKLFGHAHKAESALGGVKEMLLGIGAAFTVERGIEKGKELFIGFNKELQTLRISSAAMLQANGLAKTFDQASTSASGFVDEYLRFGQVAGILTKDIFEVSNGIAVSVAQAGGGIKDITEVAERGAVAAKAYGVNLQYASLEISEAITRGAQVRQVFAKQLIATQHMSLEEFNKLSESGRLDVIEKALSSPAMKSAALAFGQSFDGVTTRLEDMIQILGGKIGLPLFKAITAEVESWNTWLSKNEKSVEHFSKEFSDGLMTGFGYVKDVVTFIVDHKDTLLTLAKAYALMRLAGGIGGKAGASGLFGNGGAFLSGAASGAAMNAVFGDFTTTAGKINGSMMAVEGGLATLPGPIGAVAKAMLALHVGLEGLVSWIDSQHKQGVTVEATHQYIQGQLREAFGPGGHESPMLLGQVASSLKGAGALKNGVIDPGALAAYLSRATISSYESKEFGRLAAHAATYAADLAQRNASNRPFGPDLPADFDPKGNGRTKPQVVVNQHISVVNHVASNDPDRFAMDFSDALKRAATNPRQARTALRGM